MKYMRNMMKIMPLMCAALLLAGGCTRSDEADYISPGELGGEDVTIVIKVPGASLPDVNNTRSVSEVQQAEVAEVDVLVFDASGSPEMFVEHVKGRITSQSVNGSDDYKVAFKASLSEGEDRRILVVANAAAQVQALADAIDDGTITDLSKPNLLKQLRYESANAGGTSDGWKWKADGAGNDYTPIPMAGETGVVNIAKTSKFDNISLKRMLVRIDVRNSATNFVLTDVYLANYNTAGFITPEWNKTTGRLNTGYSTVPFLPGVDGMPGSLGQQTGGETAAMAWDYPLAGGAQGDWMSGEIFTFPSAASYHSQTVTTTCLVVKGYFAADATQTPYYYRVDFTLKQDSSLPTFDPSTVRYMALRRNHKYLVDITEASGIGCTDFATALSQKSVLSNLKTELLVVDMDNTPNVAFNGQNYLAVGEDITIEQYPCEFDTKITTDVPTGWVATSSDTWLTLKSGASWSNSTSASSAGTHTLSMSAEPNFYLFPRTATVTVTAGRLTTSFKVIQAKCEISLSLTDLEGNSITSLNFESTHLVDQAEPQTFVVTWTGARNDECTCTQTLRNSTSEYFPYDAASDLPAGVREAYITPGTPASHYGGSAQFTIRPAAVWDKAQSRTDMFTILEFTIYTFDGIPAKKTLQLHVKYNKFPLTYNTVGAFWRWNQSGERLVRMKAPQGDWTATVVEGADFIRLDTKPSEDPGVWSDDDSFADMNVEDAYYRLGSDAGTTISGYAYGSPSLTSPYNSWMNLYFRIGLTGSHPAGAAAGPNGTAKPSYGVVEVTHSGGTERIYVRQGEAADEVISGSGVKWLPYNISDPARGAGGTNVTDHNLVSVNDASFNRKKLTDYPSQDGYYFQWNRNRAYHPTEPGYNIAITGMPGDYSTVWNASLEICPAGYRQPTIHSTTGEYKTGLMPNSNGSNSIYGHYADGYSDRGKYRVVYPSSEAYVVGIGSGVSRRGRVFFDTGSTSASLFLPEARGRSDTGLEGKVACRYLGTSTNTAYADVFYVGARPYVTLVAGENNKEAAAYPVRCVKK